jgi:phage terminase large subunit-like protein
MTSSERSGVQEHLPPLNYSLIFCIYNLIQKTYNSSMGYTSPEQDRERVAVLRASAEERKRIMMEAANSDDPMDALVAQYMWRELIARDDQLAPDLLSPDWTYWIPLAGRGWGKTRAGAEFTREVKEHVSRIALIGPTAADCRDTLIEGESGILATSPPWDRPHYEPSKRKLSWKNGAMAFTYSAEEPERLRGPQHGAGWCDELCAWKYPETWDMFLFGLRLGSTPKVAITTTPKPTPLIKQLIKDPLARVVRGSTYDNLENLAGTFRKTVVAKFEGTRLGRQELHAEILEDNERALWHRKMIDPYRLQKKELPDFIKVVVAVDPAVSTNEKSADTGIIVVALGVDKRYYVLDDFTCTLSPDKWARRVKVAYETWHADKVVGEINNGGDLVESVIRHVMPNVKYDKVRASRGKIIRAEPIAALYEQGRVSHLGNLVLLEDQMCDYDPINSDTSPDRLDALVWGLTELSGETNQSSEIVSLGRRINR